MLLFLLYFGSNKCRLGEQKIIFYKTKILLFKNFWLVVYVKVKDININKVSLRCLFDSDLQIKGEH